MTGSRVTRGKTRPGRLRLIDPFVARAHANACGRWGGDDIRIDVVDVGIGARPETTVELHRAVRALDPAARTYGIDTDAGRVAALDAVGEPGVVAVHGGFELSFETPIGTVRAANLLRQYPLGQVTEALLAMGRWLGPEGVLVEGSTDKAGSRGVFRLFSGTGDGRLLPTCLVFAFDVDCDEGFAPRALTPYLPRGMGWHGHPGPVVAPLFEAWNRAFEQARDAGVAGGRALFVESCRRLAEGDQVRGSDHTHWADGVLVVSAFLDRHWFAHQGGVDWGQGG